MSAKGEEKDIATKVDKPEDERENVNETIIKEIQAILDKDNEDIKHECRKQFDHYRAVLATMRECI